MQVLFHLRPVYCILILFLKYDIELPVYVLFTQTFYLALSLVDSHASEQRFSISKTNNVISDRQNKIFFSILGHSIIVSNTREKYNEFINSPTFHSGNRYITVVVITIFYNTGVYDNNTSSIQYNMAN